MKHKIRWLTVILALVFTPMMRADSSTTGLSAAFKVNLEQADLTFIGEDDADWAGYFASPAGDVNGDGLGDVLIGAPMAGIKECPYPLDSDGACPGLPKGAGAGYLILGKPQDSWDENPVNLADADASFLGCEVTSMTARQLYTAGDVNGDGYDDILISGWKCGANYTGKAYLFLGRPDVDSWGRFYPVEEADASFLGENEGDFLSYYTAGAGDINGDGYDDILITSTHNDDAAEDAGKVYLILGRAAADWGKDYPVSQADASFVGEAEGDRIGRAAVGAGDVNGDGYSDFLYGSISSDAGGEDAGEVYLFLGRSSGDPSWWGKNYSSAGADASFVGEAPGDEAGRRVAEAGDVNGDGYSDFLVGSALNDYTGPDSGIAHLILGRPAADWGMRYPLIDADASFVGEAKRDQAGRRVNSAGDVNHDGYGDFIIGAPHNEQGGTLAGSAYLIYGRPAADWGAYFPLASAPVTYIGKPDVGTAGYDMAWLGDYNGDGFDDFIIAAYGGRNTVTTPGETYLILGKDDFVTPVGFTPARSPGSYRTWMSFASDFWQPSGSQDIREVELVIGEPGGAPSGLAAKYVAAENRFYLKQSSGDGWVGSCTPGEVVLLSNEVVDFNCRGSVVYSSADTLRVSWRARWIPETQTSQDLNVYLRAVNTRDKDTGYVQTGVWSISSILHFLPFLSTP